MSYYILRTLNILLSNKHAWCFGDHIAKELQNTTWYEYQKELYTFLISLEVHRGVSHDFVIDYIISYFA